MKTLSQFDAEVIRDYRSEIHSLLTALVKAGFTLVSVYRDGENVKVKSLPQAVKEADACDDCAVYVRCPDGKTRGIMLVLGNNPGELVADYHVNPALEKVLNAEQDKWEGTNQRTTTRGEKYGKSR